MDEDLQAFLLRLPHDLRERIRIRAAREERTQVQVVRRAIRYYLDTTNPDGTLRCAETPCSTPDRPDPDGPGPGPLSPSMRLSAPVVAGG